MKILHIINDEKFIDTAYRLFEAVSPGNNQFLLISESSTITYIKETPVKLISKKKLLDAAFLNTLTHYDMVVLHYLDNIKLQLLACTPQNVKFVWLGWGADYYYLIYTNPSELLKPLTQHIYYKHRKPIIIRIITKVIRELLSSKISKSEVINKVSYFAPVLLEDYQLVKNALPNFKPQFLSWNYGTLEDDLIKGLEKVSISGDNILLGNSATYSNNHFDSLELLKNISLSGRKIYCPLSYGNSNLKKDIITRGKRLHGENFIPVTDFMPIEQYVQLISSCSIVIMNHLRQQALGNIVIMMYLGAKVFIDKQNPIYSFFKKEGAFVYSLDDFISEHPHRLDMVSVEQNRHILQRHWSRKVILEKTRLLIETVTSH